MTHEKDILNSLGLNQNNGNYIRVGTMTKQTKYSKKEIARIAKKTGYNKAGINKIMSFLKFYESVEDRTYLRKILLKIAKY